MFHLVNVVQFICHFTIEPVLQQFAVVCRPFGALQINTLIWTVQIRIADMMIINFHHHSIIIIIIIREDSIFNNRKYWFSENTGYPLDNRMLLGKVAKKKNVKSLVLYPHPTVFGG